MIPKVDQTALDLEFWQSIKNSKNPEDFEDYINKYPEGNFISLAQRRLNSLLNNKRKKEKEQEQRKKEKEQEQRQKENIIKADNQAWELARIKSTISAYKKYLQDYPSGLHASDGRIKIREMTELPSYVRKVNVILLLIQSRRNAPAFFWLYWRVAITLMGFQTKLFGHNYILKLKKRLNPLAIFTPLTLTKKNIPGELPGYWEN